MSVSSARGNCSTGEKGKGTDSEREEEICPSFDCDVHTQALIAPHTEPAATKVTGKQVQNGKAGRVLGCFFASWLAHRVLH